MKKVFKKNISKKQSKQKTQSRSQWDKPTWVKDNKVIDYLSEDDDVNEGLPKGAPKVTDQTYVCVSCCSLKDKQLEEEIQLFCEENGLDFNMTYDLLLKWHDRSDPKRSFKIRGCYSNWDIANARVDYLRRVHGANHAVFIGHVGKWLPFDPDPNKVENQNFYESQLNELHEGKERNQAKAKEHFETRKQELMRKARLEGSKWGQENYMKEKETKESVGYKVKAAEQQIEEFTKKIKEAEQSKKLAEEKLQYMEQHPEIVLENKVEIEDVIPEDIKDEILSQKPSTETLKALAAHREIDDNRVPFDITKAKQSGQQREGTVHDVFNDEQLLPHKTI